MAYSNMKHSRVRTKLEIYGFNAMTRKLDKISNSHEVKRQLYFDMLKAAEPVLKKSMDEQMAEHPGELQKSIKSTGVQKSLAGWYLAVRATDTRESTASKRDNLDKMLYLTTRQYITKRNGKPIKLKNGKDGYVIPENDVISAAIDGCRNEAIDAMQQAFDKLMTDYK